MKNGIFISILALSLAAITASDVQAQQPLAALCNTIGADGAGPVQQIARQGDLSQCGEFGLLFGEFVGAGCLPLFNAGELQGIFGAASTSPAGPNEGVITNFGQTVCDSVNACGLCPTALTLGICVMTCTI